MNHLMWRPESKYQEPVLLSERYNLVTPKKRAAVQVHSRFVLCACKFGPDLCNFKWNLSLMKARIDTCKPLAAGRTGGTTCHATLASHKRRT